MISKADLIRLKKATKGLKLSITDYAKINGGQIEAVLYSGYSIKLKCTPNVPEGIKGLVLISELDKLAKANLLDGSITVSENKLQFSKGKKSATIELNKDLLPDFVNVDEKKYAEFVATFTAKELKEFSLHTSNDDMRPVLKGVCINTTGTFATDAHTMRFDLDKTFSDEIIIPFEMLNLRDVHKDYDLYVQDDFLEFRSADNSDIISGLRVDGKYPQATSVIPKQYDHNSFFKMPKKELLSVIKELLPFANSSTKKAIISNSGISTDDIDFGSGMTIDCFNTDNSNIENKIGVNLNLFKRCIDSIDSEVITFTFDAPNRPLLVHGTDQPGALLMPIALDH